jgi:hypothetical protein
VKLQALVGPRRPLVTILLIGVNAWCVIKFLGWVSFYSSWASELGDKSVLARAHLWALSYALGSVLLGIGATVSIASASRKPYDGLTSTRYLLAALAVTASIIVCIVLNSLYSVAFHHRLGVAHT